MISCGRETEDIDLQVLEGSGTVWLSGGLMYCSTQVRMDYSDTLVPNQFNIEIMKLTAGTRIRIKYLELAIRESRCTIGKDCKIIEVKMID